MNSVNEQEMNEVLRRAEALSPWLRGLMRRFPDERDKLSRGKFDLSPPAWLQPAGWDETRRELRRARGRHALAIALADLSGSIGLDDVMAHLTRFADWAVDQAVSAAIEAHVPGAASQGFTVIALGKQGSGELNYSSDIDPIFLFDPETLPCRPTEDPGEAAVRIGRRVIELLQARDGDGYVLRVDLRLRPNPEVTPIAISINAAIGYYESEALAWERAAFIRARPCAGDLRLGNRFLQAIQPFIWRRGLDFGAITEIRAISHRIRDHFHAGQDFGPGYDLKRGRGGIRECEFFAQIHQLIHGGREASLRTPATCDALSALAEAGRIKSKDAQTLTAAYQRYRQIEHRLQMMDDQQTHSLPISTDALNAVAQLDGLASGKALLRQLAPHVDRVGHIYDSLDGGGPAHVPVAPDRLEPVLKAAGFPNPSEAAKRISHWRSGTLRAVRTVAAREALEAVLPKIIANFGKAPDPVQAINHFSRLIERLPSAINLFRLLEAQPALMQVLTTILLHAPPLAEALTRTPQLLDRLLDASAFDLPGSVDVLADEMRMAGPVEAQLDKVRSVVGEHRFGLGVQLVQGTADPVDVAAGYARIAEAAISVIGDATIAEFERAHGRVPGSELVILALGRLGGRALTHASDLDLILLFTGSFQGESGGPKSLGAVHYFNRLAQRVIAGLSVQTAAGSLYEVDTRLRPSGAKGPLTVSLAGFARYQAEEAWTWEHMALCRARTVYGSAAARQEAETAIKTALCRPRSAQSLLADARQMHADIRAHKPPKGPLDVKLCEGGLVDLEFAVHVTQLRHQTGFDPALGPAIEALVDGGWLDPALIDAHLLLTRMLVSVRLLAPDLSPPDAATQALIARACSEPSWAKLLEELISVRQRVSQIWTEMI